MSAKYPHTDGPKVNRGRRMLIATLLAACGAAAPACGQMLDYGGEQFARDAQTRFQTGFATYYASTFEGRRTASGAVFRQEALMAAHPNLPFGTLARVTNLIKGSSVLVRIADRGPAAAPRSKGVIIDLSHQAAKQLGFTNHGRVRVAVQPLAATRTLAAARAFGSGSGGALQEAREVPLRLDLTLAAAPEVDHVAIAGCPATACAE